MKNTKPNKSEIGWREHVGLPDLGIASLTAKVDTGARTSALHAVDHAFETRDGEDWVTFTVPHPDTGKDVRVSAPVLDEREITNTSGVPEQRIVIATTMQIGTRRWPIEVSLADRENMTFDMILGRTAIRGRRLVVAPGKSFLAGKPRRKPRPPKAARKGDDT